VEADISNYGGIVVALRVPDRGGTLGNVVLGYDTADEYLHDPFFLGALIGRYANRIAGGHLVVGDQRFELTRNNGENHLHGGPHGFHKVLWSARPFENEREVGLELAHTSPDGHEGYPGNLSVTVVYALTRDAQLTIRYVATSDRDTVVNLTHHSYFNLGKAGAVDILDHDLVLDADSFTPGDRTQIPTGELRSVTGTPFDFRKPTRIGTRIDDADEQLRAAGGYDHNWVLNGSAGTVRLVARAWCRSTGRVVDVSTSEPGIQLYTGNSLPDHPIGTADRRLVRRSGLCLETQHFPDSPNKPEFPSTLLRAGATFRSMTSYRFWTSDDPWASVP
jgi:aldose 1-epimerase